MLIPLVFLFLSSSHSMRVSEEMRSLLKKSSRGDYGNKVTCKKPSVKTMVYLWEQDPSACIAEDPNEYLSVYYTKYLNEKASEVQAEFMETWGQYLKLAWGADSWRPQSGKGLNDKSYTKHMIYNNLDSSYLLGTQVQFNLTLHAAVDNKDPPQGFVNVFEFITDGIGGLLSTYHLQPSSELLQKIKQAGLELVKVYENWYPYTLYDFQEGKGKYERIPMKALVNLNEIYKLYEITGDSRYKEIAERVTKGLRDVLDGQIVPEFGEIEDGEIQMRGVITSEYFSSEVGKILYNNWLLSNRTDIVSKGIYDKLKNLVLTRVALGSSRGEIILIERNEKGVRPRMNMKMCQWAGILAEESRNDFNNTELITALKLIQACFVFFNDEKLPSDYIYMEKKNLYQVDSDFSIPSELFESLYYIFKATHDTRYRELGYYAYSVIKSHCKVMYGYTIPGKDLMPQDFFSKTLKYLFLIFDENRRFSHPIISSSGHFLG